MQEVALTEEATINPIQITLQARIGGLTKYSNKRSYELTNYITTIMESYVELAGFFFLIIIRVQNFILKNLNLFLNSTQYF